MKVCYLSQINKKRYLFRTYTFKDKLNSYNNLVADLITAHEDFIGDEQQDGSLPDNIINKIKEAEKTINFKIEKNKIVIPSPYTKRFLKTDDSKPFVLMIGLNNAGERLNCLIQQQSGKVKSCKYEFLADLLSKEEEIEGKKVKINHLANMFVRNGSELVLLDGSLDMPIISIGEKLPDPSLTEDRTLKVDEKANDNKERWIIKKMREKNYPVDKYNLTNPNYPETTLMYYYELFEAGRENIVSCMLTTQDFDIPQLKEIAEGINSGVAITKYADPLIDATEMANIRKGLEGDTLPDEAIPHNKIIKKLYKDRNYGKIAKAFSALAQSRLNKKKNQ